MQRHSRYVGHVVTQERQDHLHADDDWQACQHHLAGAGEDAFASEREPRVSAPARAHQDEQRAEYSSANELVLALDQTLTNVVRAGEAWEAVGLAFRSDEGENPDSSGAPDLEEPDEPSIAQEFDITARSVTAAAVEIRGILADVRELAASEDPDTMVEAATLASKRTIDHTAWRGAQLILVALGAAIVYLLVKARLQRRAEGS